MRKLKLFFACLLMAVLSIGQVWADPAAVGTTLFSENFGGYAADAVPSGSVTTATGRVVYGGGSVTYTCADNGTNLTKIYAANLAGGTSPELLVGKSGGVFTITGIPSGDAQEITVSFKQNAQKLTISLDGTGYSTTYASPKPSAAGTVSFDITVADGADATFSLIMTAGSSNVRVDDILVTVKTAGEGGAPAKTLSSVAVSGAPTKTAYYVGDEFDPAGLVVTGTYSDDSQAAITSGITWAYDPSQELALNQTSIGVTATVNEISSPKFNVTGLTVTEVPAAATYEKVTSTANITDGDYLIVYEDGNVAFNGALTTLDAVGNTVAVTINDGVITGSVAIDAATVTISTTAKTIQTASGYYIGITSYGNGLSSSTSSAYEHQNISIDGGNVLIYFQQQSWNSNKNGKMQLCYNSGSDQRRFRYFKEGSQKAIQLYKKVDGTVKPSAGLAFDAAQKLAKVDGTLTAPILSTADGFDGTVTYASSDETVVKVNASTGAITEIVAAGKAVITAHSDATENFKEGSASYTIFVAEQAGTAEDPLTEASAKDLIDLGCTMSAHVTGTIQGKTYYSNSGSYNVTLTNGFLFYYFYAAENSTPFESDILTNGDVLVGYGQLMKYGNNYEINPSYMVSRVPYSEPLVDISNTPETAYTPAYAIQLYNDPTSDLTKEVYVKGVVVATPALKYNDGLTGDAAVYNGTYNVYVKAEDDLSENPTKFEFFRMYADDNNTTFEDGDIQVGEVIIAKGILSKFNSTYEFAQGCQMYSKKSKVTMTFDDLEMEVEDVETLAPKTITLATAEAVTYAIKEGSDDCITLANGVVTATAEGTATIVATVATVEAYIGTSVEFTVTVSAAAPVLTDYYEKVTETTGITDGTYLIVYENGNVAFNGGLETLDAESNTIAVAITNDNKIGVTEVTAAATFFIDVTAGSIQAANGQYIGVSSNSNGLKTSDDASTYTNAFAIDNDGNAVISAVFSESTMTMRYNSASNQARFRYYKDNGQQAIQLYKLANETVKANPELAWSEESVELTVGGDFTSPTLSHADGITGTITYTSDKETVATVDENGVISLVAEATGTAHITAYYAGDENYKAASVSCTIIVNASAPTPVTDNVVILATYGAKLYAMSTTLSSSAFTAIEVEEDGSNIVVPSADAKAAIQWTRTITGENTTFQDADSKYMAGGTGNTNMSLADDPCNWGWNATDSYYFIGSRSFFYYKSGVFKNYSTSNAGGDDYSGYAEVRVIDPANIVVTSKVSAELAYDPESDEITEGDAWSAPTLVNPYSVTITSYASDNESVATVEGGVIALAGGIGTAHITAHFAGDASHLEGDAVYTITVNAPAPTPTGTTYTKVTSTSDITDGEYLIVYEGDANHASVAFDGALEILDAIGNGVAVIINEGEIAGNTEIDGAIFTIDVTAGTLQSASGKYIGVSSNDNGLKQTENAETYSHNFSIDGDGNAVIAAAFEGSTMTLRYNYSTNNGLRFRYYKNNGQQAIQLYKKDVPAPTYVAQIGTTGYETFAEAIAAVADDETIQLLQDCSYSDYWTLEDKDVTVDLNGKHLSYTGTNYYGVVLSNGTLTVKDQTMTVDPTIDMTADPLNASAITYANSGKWTFTKAGVNILADGAMVVNSGWMQTVECVACPMYNGIVTVNNGVLVATDNGVLMGNGSNGKGGYTINVHGGILLGMIQSAGYASMAIYHPNTGVLNIDGGILVSTNGPGVVVRAGESHITGGTIVAQGTVAGKCGDANAPKIAGVGVAYDFKANYPGEDIVATITGGDIAGEVDAVVAIYAATDPTPEEVEAIAISGGQFSSEVDANLCAEGFAPVDTPNDQGKYEVEEAPFVQVRNGLQEGWYYTMCLNKAVTAVQGGTIWRVLSKAENGTDVILEEVTGILEAGRPYFFYATAANLEVQYYGVEVSAPVNDDANNGLIGSFIQAHIEPTQIEDVYTNYILWDNALYFVNSDNVYVGAHRAYLDMTGVPAYSNEPQQGNAPGRRVTMTVHGEQTATGIDALNASETPVKVLRDGQIFILRGEKMYNVNGQIVK